LVAVLAKIDPVSWPEIDPEFMNACPDALHIGKVTKLHACQCNGDLRGGLSIEALKPVPVRTVSAGSRYSRICTK
jgi:hypothetical protein